LIQSWESPFIDKIKKLFGNTIAGEWGHSLWYFQVVTKKHGNESPLNQKTNCPSFQAVMNKLFGCIQQQNLNYQYSL
jgi:hypothetical protein